MLRPWWIDLVMFMLPIAIGYGAFVGGQRLPALSRLVVRTALGSVAALLLIMLVVWLIGAGDTLGWLLLPIGGTVLVACCLAAFILGGVWNLPGRRVSPFVLKVLFGLLTGVLALASGGRLYWRLYGDSAFTNVPNSGGIVGQTTGWTSAPAGAAMLLYRHGINTSEGEIAYLAGASVFGADVPSLLQAIDAKAAPHGLRAQIDRIDFARLTQLDRTCLAETDAPSFGMPVLMIKRASDNDIELIDPQKSLVEHYVRSEFTKHWTGRVIYLVPAS